MLLRFIIRVNRIADHMNVIMFFFMTASVITAVLCRYLFRIPLPEVMDLAYFAMLWAAFLQTGKALYKDRHVSMPFIIDNLSYKPKAIAGIMINIIILLTAGALFWYSTFFTLESLKYGWNYSGSFPMPMFLLYGIMALGSFYLGIIAIFKIFNTKEQLKTSK